MLLIPDNQRSAGFTDISSSAQVTVHLVHHVFLRTVYGTDELWQIGHLEGSLHVLS